MPVPTVVYEGVQGAPTLFLIPTKPALFPGQAPTLFTLYAQQPLIDTLSVSVRWEETASAHVRVTDVHGTNVGTVTVAGGFTLPVLVNTVQQSNNIPQTPGRIQLVASGPGAVLTDEGPNLPVVQNASPAIPVASWYMQVPGFAQFDFDQPIYVRGVVGYCGSNQYIEGGGSFPF